jgi:hypothetical protein
MHILYQAYHTKAWDIPKDKSSSETPIAFIISIMPFVSIYNSSWSSPQWYRIADQRNPPINNSNMQFIIRESHNEFLGFPRTSRRNCGGIMVTLFNTRSRLYGRAKVITRKNHGILKQYIIGSWMHVQLYLFAQSEADPSYWM